MKFTHLLAVCSLSLVGLVATSAHADALADITKIGTVRIAVPQDFPPYGSVTADMQLQGLDIEVAQLVAKKMGLKLVMVPVASANRIPYLQSNRVDLVISTLGRNAEREKVMDFSNPMPPTTIACLAWPTSRSAHQPIWPVRRWASRAAPLKIFC